LEVLHFGDSCFCDLRIEGLTERITPPIFPSSNQIDSPARTSEKLSGRDTPIVAGYKILPLDSQTEHKPAFSLIHFFKKVMEA
jgi:hypothetical protein